VRLFELLQPKGKVGVFAFGRMNPPTIGHEVLVNRVLDISNKYKGDHLIFLSQTHKPPKDPLPFDLKQSIFQQAFPQANLYDGVEKKVRTPYDALSVMADRYDHIVMVVGSDRVNDFKKMRPYAIEYGAKAFEVVSAGERDPDAEGTAGMSASKARSLAAEGDFEAFRAALPASVTKTKALQAFRTIRKNIR